MAGSAPSSALPHITDPVDLGNAGLSDQRPAVQSWPPFPLVFGPGSSGSTLRNVHLMGLVVEAGVSGMTIAANTIEGQVTIAGDRNVIGGTAPGEGNNFAAASTLIANFMSVTGDENEFYRNTFGLMSIAFAQGNRVGSVGNGNTFVGKTTHPSASTTDALLLRSAPTIVEGNTIGSHGTWRLHAGIHVVQASPPGGPSRIAGNVIYGGSGHPAVWVEGPVSGVEILGNPILAPGIALTGGANDDQPPPELAGALWQPSGITVTGIVRGAPGTLHIVELYGGRKRIPYSCCPDFVVYEPTLSATFDVTTDAAGTVEFTHTIPAGIPLDDIQDMAATATNAVTRSTSATSYGIIVDEMTTFALGSASYAVHEEDAQVTIPVVRSGGSRECCFEVTYKTVNGTARAGEDYEGVSDWTNVAFSDPMSSEAVITIPIRRDRAREPDETFTVLLSVPPLPHVTLGTATATVTILAAQEPIPTLSQWALLLLTLGLATAVLIRLR
ncbi:MAG TPA: IPTL-CTERM sorting domain-containing protein [Thermoanaerobaculia bacterium]